MEYGEQNVALSFRSPHPMLLLWGDTDRIAGAPDLTAGFTLGSED